MPDTALNQALVYASYGVASLPLHYIDGNGYCSCGAHKRNETCKPAKHPFGKLVRRGLKNATTDQTTLHMWFKNNPYNIGIITGTRSGFFVVDCDDRDGGSKTIETWAQRYGHFTNTLTQRTGNGYHYLFRIPVGAQIRNSQRKIAPGIDIKGEHGYICAAPSIHENGKVYEWQSPNGFNVDEISEAPDWLVEIVLGSQASGTQITSASSNKVGFFGELPSEFELPISVKDGEGREVTLLRYAGHLRQNNYSQNEIERRLLEYNEKNISPPLAPEIVLSKARRYRKDQDSAIIEVQNEWSTPLPIRSALPPVPSFNVGLLPKSLRNYVSEVALAMSCPIEFPAVAAMTALASAIGRKIHCKPEKHTRWLVPSGLWSMVISPPSHIKTPPIMEMLKPLSLIDQKACEKYRSELSLYDIQKAIYEKAVKKAVSQGSTAPGMPIPIPPRQTRHLVNDSTYEMLIAIAKDNPDGFLVYRDELVSWFHSINKESQKEARGLYLSGWNGTQSYATDRIGRGHLRAESVNISLIGTIQPNVLRQIVFDAISGGTGDDGLVQRFQLAVYPDPVREFTKMSRDQDFTEMLRYERLITRLVNLTPNDVGAVVDTSGNAYLSFDPSAQAFFDAWREDLERRIRSEQLEDKPAFLSHLGKYRSLMPKIALILHISDGLTCAITISSAKKAAAWLLMLEAHAHRIYHTATNPATKASNALAKAIRQRKVKDGFTRSELLMRELSGLRTSDEINAALRVLKDLQWVASREYRNTGGRPLERFFINPKLYID